MALEAGRSQPVHPEIIKKPMCTSWRVVAEMMMMNQQIILKRCFSLLMCCFTFTLRIKQISTTYNTWLKVKNTVHSEYRYEKWRLSYARIKIFIRRQQVVMNIQGTLQLFNTALIIASNLRLYRLFLTAHWVRYYADGTNCVSVDVHINIIRSERSAHL